MTESSAPQPSSSQDQPLAVSAPDMRLTTSVAHQWLTMIGLTFVIFEIFFLQLYSDNFWFDFNLIPFGLPAVLVAGLLAYGVLRALDTKWAWQLCRFAWKGAPPVVFRNWLNLDARGFEFGMRRVEWRVVSELHLTWFGNLQVRSQAICGQSHSAEVVLTFPFGLASQAVQQKFIEAFKNACPDAALNERLQKRLSSPVVKGQNAIQLLGAVMMTAILLDVGISSTYYLEMLKHYYLADKNALANEQKIAVRQLEQADDLRAHPFPVSYVTCRFLKVGVSASGLLEARAEALWAMGRRQEAISDMRKAVEMQPDVFRLYLHLARYLADAGQPARSQDTIAEAIEHHKDSLLPRLYMVALLKESRPRQVPGFYKQSLSDLDESTFQETPTWPPGGSRFVHDLFYRDDITFIFERLLRSSESRNFAK